MHIEEIYLTKQVCFSSTICEACVSIALCIGFISVAERLAIMHAQTVCCLIICAHMYFQGDRYLFRDFHTSPSCYIQRVIASGVLCQM